MAKRTKKPSLRNTPLPDGRIKDTRWDAILVLCRARGMTLEASAEAADCSLHTAWRRDQDPDFQRAVRYARDQMVSEGLGLLSDLFVKAIKKMEQVLDHREALPAVQLAAAEKLVNSLLKTREHVAIHTRLAALEERLRQLTGEGNGESTEATPGTDGSAEAAG